MFLVLGSLIAEGRHDVGQMSAIAGYIERSAARFSNIRTAFFTTALNARIGQIFLAEGNNGVPFVAFRDPVILIDRAASGAFKDVGTAKGCSVDLECVWARALCRRNRVAVILDVATCEWKQLYLKLWGKFAAKRVLKLEIERFVLIGLPTGCVECAGSRNHSWILSCTRWCRYIRRCCCWFCAGVEWILHGTTSAEQGKRSKKSECRGDTRKRKHIPL